MDYKEKYEKALEIVSKCPTDKYGCIIGVKPSDLFQELSESEDERIRKEMLKIAKESEDSFYMVMTPNKRERLIAWLEKQGVQKPAWGEEDEHKFKIVISALVEDYEATPELINWFKSLKERVQPKQEWSEEDFKNYMEGE